MDTFDPFAYSITVRRETVDDEIQFVATVAELPDVSALADSHAEAVELVADAITELKIASDEDGKVFPSPAHVESEFSGRVTLRMERSLHRSAAAIAEIEGVSLNSFVVSALVARVTGGHMPMHHVKDFMFRIERLPVTRGSVVVGTNAAVNYVSLPDLQQRHGQTASDYFNVIDMTKFLARSTGAASAIPPGQVELQN
jgi:predicted HicB family RNase H-like nuclease